MNKIRFLNIVLIILMLEGCNSPCNSSDISLTSQAIITDSIYMRYPFRITMTDSLVYITDLHGPEYFCHVFNSDSLQHVQSFMKRGNGPNEYTDAENIRIDKSGRIYVLDANVNKIAIWNKTATDTTYRIPLSHKLIRTLDFDLINDSLLVTPDYSGKHRYHIIDCKGNIIKSCQHIPVKEKTDCAGIVQAQAWRSFIDYNPDNGILAMATQLGQVIELYDLKADTVIKIIYGEQGEPRFIDNGAYAVPNGIMGYGDIHVTNNKIYALFWGMSFKDIRNNMNIKQGGNYIEVYDLKGEPLYRYLLDRQITGFCVDEPHKQLLALDINSDSPLVSYQLKNN